MIRSSLASALRALADLVHPSPQQRAGVVLVDAPITFKATPSGDLDPAEIHRLCAEAMRDIHAMRDRGAS